MSARRFKVRVWEDYITLPSYVLDGYDIHPMFDELYGRECYPYPQAWLKGDRRKVRNRYLAVHLENEFLEVVCFPHFGGRIYSCRDKITGQDIFHPVERVSVAYMPGESGGTYSGCGVEISFPAHHSMTNTRKREYQVLHNHDSSATIVMGEMELRMRMRWEVHITLRPGIARLEQEMRIHNRTFMYGRGQYWGNASMYQGKRFQVSYPETSGYEHGLEYVIGSWPVYDGVDMRFPVNVPAPYGVEMKDVRDGYYAYYDHDRQFGMVHWAEPDEAPGKKYWTWGSSEHLKHRAEWFADGKDYLEMQSGRVEDQAEFEIYPPFCFKKWREVWYPVRNIGPVDAAGPDVALSCQERKGGAHVCLQVVKSNPGGEIIIINNKGVELARRSVVLSAGKVSNYELDFNRKADEFRVMVLSRDKLLTAFFQRKPKFQDVGIERACTIDKPRQPETADDFMMVHERYLEYLKRRWTDFEKVLQKALEVDPNHTAAHRWMGIWLVRRRLFKDAEAHLDNAIERCKHDGEAHFYKGLCRLATGDETKAEWEFKMAFRNNEEDRGAFMLGVLAFRAGSLDEALNRFNACLDANANNLRGRLYRALVLSLIRQQAEAYTDIEEVRRRMPNETLAPVVEIIISRNSLKGFLNTAPGKRLAKQLRKDVQTYLELICDLMYVGLFAEALQLANEVIGECSGEPGICLIDFYRGYLFHRLGRHSDAKKCFSKALKADRKYAFTFRDEEESVISCAQEYFPKEGVVRHYRALIRGKQARYEEAYAEWLEAVRLGVKDPVIYRGLAAIADKHKGDSMSAEKFLDTALVLNPDDVMVRRDLLALVRARKDKKKFARLISYPGLASTLLIEEIINFQVAIGDYDKAVRAITEEAKFPNSCQDYHHLYELALNARAFHRIKERDFVGAEKDLRLVFDNPGNLGIGIRKKRVMSLARYLLGLALRGQRRENEACKVWEDGINEQEMVYWMGAGSWNYGLWIDRYWQGRMLLELGRKTEANTYFEGLLVFAMSKGTFLDEPQRREVYTLAREGTAGRPVTAIVTSVEYLALE